MQLRAAQMLLSAAKMRRGRTHRSRRWTLAPSAMPPLATTLR